MNLDFLIDYMVPVIIGICLCLGYLIKSWEAIPNKWIPTILAMIGLTVALWIHKWAATPEIILMGMVSGLASCGLYDTFKHMFIDGGEE